MIDPKALDAAFGRGLAQIVVLLGDGDVIAIEGPAGRAPSTSPDETPPRGRSRSN